MGDLEGVNGGDEGVFCIIYTILAMGHKQRGKRG